MHHVIHGTTLQSLEIYLQPWEGWRWSVFGNLAGPRQNHFAEQPIVNLAEEIARDIQAPERSEGAGRVVGDIVGGLFGGE